MHEKSLAGTMLIYLLWLTTVCSSLKKVGFIVQLCFYHFSGK